VRVKDVPLQAGRTEHEVRLWVSNADGPTLRPGTVKIFRPEAPPVVTIDTGTDGNVWRSRLPVKVQVRSDRKLTGVRLVHQGLPPLAVDVSRQRLNALGLYELDEKVTVRLARDVNRLHAEATSDRGTEASRAVLVSYTPPPISVHIDRIVLRGGAEEIRPERLAGNPLHFPEIASSQVQIHGKVIWGDPDEEDDGRREMQRLQVRVNGFQQLPARLDPKGRKQNATPFAIPVLLTRSTNHIRLVLPGLPGKEGVAPDLRLDCKAPEELQRLHLLVISANPDTSGQLGERIQRIFKGSEKGSGKAPSPFKEVIPYGEMKGDQIRWNNIERKLYMIHTAIEQLSRRQQASDVLLVYYEGAERVGKRGNLLKDKASPDERAFGLDFQQLAERMADVPGAALIFLEVEHDGKPQPGAADRIAKWKEAPRPLSQLGILRLAWAGAGRPGVQAALLPALQTALDHGRLLPEVAGLVLRTAEREGFQGFSHVPEDLEGLPVGRGGKANPP
jgi:hypothetical protein